VIKPTLTPTTSSLLALNRDDELTDVDEEVAAAAATNGGAVSGDELTPATVNNNKSYEENARTSLVSSFKNGMDLTRVRN
jgi:hypothetical protein